MVIFIIVIGLKQSTKLVLTSVQLCGKITLAVLNSAKASALTRSVKRPSLTICCYIYSIIFIFIFFITSIFLTYRRFKHQYRRTICCKVAKEHNFPNILIRSIFPDLSFPSFSLFTFTFHLYFSLFTFTFHFSHAHPLNLPFNILAFPPFSDIFTCIQDKTSVSCFLIFVY